MATCKFPTCQRHAEKNGYCVRHKIYAATTTTADPKKKPQKRIRRRSVKLASKEREYVKIIRQMLAESPYCELQTSDCTGVAEGGHHMKGRGVNLLVRKWIKRACNACNRYVETHPHYALANGLSVSRHAREQ